MVNGEKSFLCPTAMEESGNWLDSNNNDNNDNE